MSDIFLLSCGTLRLPDVQMALFGRRAEGMPDAHEVESMPGAKRSHGRG